MDGRVKFDGRVIGKPGKPADDTARLYEMLWKVIQEGSRWWRECGDIRIGPFASKELAERGR